MEKSLFVNRQKRANGILLSICSGILLVLSFPKFNFSILAWIGLVPLMAGIECESILRSFWLGFLSGIVFFLGTLYWIVNTMVNYGHINIFLSYLLLILLSLYLSLYFGMFCYILTAISRHDPILKGVFAPFIWVSLEYIRSRFLTGFPWASLGYSQFNSLKIIQISDITGIYGVSFLIVMVNAAVSYVIENFNNRGGERILLSKRRAGLNPRPVIISVMILSLCYIYGLLRIDENISLENYAKPVSVKVVQGNIDQDQKWDKKYQTEVFNTYKDMTLKNMSNKRTDLVVWPETALPFYFYNDEKRQQDMLDLASMVDTYIFFGSPRYTLINMDKVNMFNSAFLISPEQDIKGVYDKIHLVPFGEYVPFRKLLWFVDKMVEGIGDFVQGKELKVFAIPKARFSSLICFEVIFPNLVRKFVKRGAQFLVNITNDAWFGRSAASYQHISMVAFRAVENRVPIIRAANTGISAIITPYGRIENTADIFVRTSIYGDVTPKNRANTFYTAYGDVFAFMCIIVLAVFGGWALVVR